MGLGSIVRLVVLAAIWGSFFLFMKIASPVLGAPMVAELRVGLAAVFLLSIALYLRKPFQLSENWRHYLIVGFFNSALPFLLFCYTALNLTVSMLSILNATSPIWGAVCVAFWDRQWMSLRSAFGLVLGVIGVSILLGFDPIVMQLDNVLPICAVLLAAACYGLTSTYTRHVKSVDPFNNAHGSMWGATLALLFVIPFFPIQVTSDIDVIAAVVILGVLCSGVAYLLYFRLVNDVGAPSALTVTFLVPVFGVLWGCLFLDETIGWHTLVGALTVVGGTMLVTGFSLKRLFKEKVNDG